MAICPRRRFLQSLLAAGAAPLVAAQGTATDWVTLGKSNVKVTRLAFGTGSFSGRVQRELGQEEFTRLVRYAYDRGIRFFETAESYGEMHKMLGIALKGIPRDTYRLMTKLTTREGTNPQEKIDELRRLAQTDYFDIVLLHYQHFATWPKDSMRWQDGISEARVKQADEARSAAEAQAKETSEKLASLIAAAGIDAKATDYKAAIAAAIKTAASKEAAEILAAQGQTKPVDNARSEANTNHSPAAVGLDRVEAALRARREAGNSNN